MYFDYILESENTILSNKIIENATYEMCINGGDEMIKNMEDYINLLEDNDHEPTQEFDNFIFENLSPYLENESKYIGMFLLEWSPKWKNIPEETRNKITNDRNTAKKI